LRRKPDVQRKEDCVCLQYAIVGLEQPVTIRAEERDTIAGLHAGFTQRAREPAHTLGKLRVREPLVSTHDRRVIRVLFLCISKET
jgi:hypothetical protein